MGEGLAYDRKFTYTPRGQLAKVVDRTANVPVGPITPDTTPGGAAGLYCQARSYGFNTDGARTSHTVAQYNSGVCEGAASHTSTRTYSLDNANRFTTGVTIDAGAPGGAYTYDGLGRQTTIPASDSPNGQAAVTLGYYVDDLPASVTQAGVTTSFTLDAAGRRATQSTTGGLTDGHTVARHYGDESDNPAWVVTTPKNGASQVTRFTDSISGDLGASITSAGETSIGIVDPHDNNVTSVTIPATQTSGTAATAVTGWARWAEYGAPAAAPAVTGPLGYGWLGAKQRETSTDAAGLTLMGVRYYNWATGTFTGPDPIPGGNDTSFGYPTDPINNTDPTGEWGWLKKAARWASRHKMEIAMTAAVFVPGAGVAAASWRAYKLARGGVYAFRTLRGGRYVGQSQNVGKRLGQHVASGRISPWQARTARVYYVRGNKLRREVAEQRAINRRGGISRLENKINPIGPRRAQHMKRISRQWWNFL